MMQAQRRSSRKQAPEAKNKEAEDKEAQAGACPYSPDVQPNILDDVLGRSLEAEAMGPVHPA